jgi:hypothetical protein
MRYVPMPRQFTSRGEQGRNIKAGEQCRTGESSGSRRATASSAGDLERSRPLLYLCQAGAVASSTPTQHFLEHAKANVVRSNDPPIGAGEEVLAAVGAAIANALFDATGKRLMEYPMTPERVLAALRG